MTEKRRELSIPLPQNRVLRALALYALAGGAILMSVPIVVRAMALPAWLPTLTVLIILVLASVAALAAWLTQPRG